MSRWPLWRVLVSIEAWLLIVAALHRYSPIHNELIVPLLLGIVPGVVLVAMWGLARAATGETASAEQRASWVELSIASVTVVAATGWIAQWALEAWEDLRRIDEVLGEATIIIDVSLTGLSAAACLAALALDWLLATAHEQLRTAMAWLRRTHIVVTAALVLALFGSAWLFVQWPDATSSESPALFHRARAALYVYQFAKATVFPAQAFFAALAVVVVTLDSRST